MRETWYVLEDDEVADPADVSIGSDGQLVHSSGSLVAMNNGVPRSRGVDDPAAARAAAREKTASSKPAQTVKVEPAVVAAKEPAVVAPEPPKATRELAAEKPKRGYKTRGAKVV